MKAITRKNKGYIDLIVEKDKKTYLVMRLDKNEQGVGWEIYDFRYSSSVQPTSRPAANDLQYFKITPEARKYQSELFPFPVKEEKEHWTWYLNNGIVLEGQDYPVEKQAATVKRAKRTGYIISELAAWKYKTALIKMKEAKEFWKNFNGDWSEAKVENKYLNPPGDIAMQYLLDSLIERDSKK